MRGFYQGKSFSRGVSEAKKGLIDSLGAIAIAFKKKHPVRTHVWNLDWSLSI
jgi:hypothetical protein